VEKGGKGGGDKEKVPNGLGKYVQPGRVNESCGGFRAGKKARKSRGGGSPERFVLRHKGVGGDLFKFCWEVEGQRTTNFEAGGKRENSIGDPATIKNIKKKNGEM